MVVSLLFLQYKTYGVGVFGSCPNPYSHIPVKRVKRSSKHACLVLFLSFCTIGVALNGGVHSHQVLAQSSSLFSNAIDSTKVSCSIFALLACEPVTSSTKVSCSVFTLLARETITFTTRVSCNTFTSLVCELVTSTNQIKQVTPTFQLVVAFISNNNASHQK